MFSRATKSVVTNFGQRNDHTVEHSFKQNTKALVQAAERSCISEFLTPFTKKTIEKSSKLERNDSVIKKSKNDSWNEKRKDVESVLKANREETRRTLNSPETIISKDHDMIKAEGGELLEVLQKNFAANEGSSIAASRHLKSFPSSEPNQGLGILKQGGEICSRIIERGKILGEMGPSPHSRFRFSSSNIEVCLPEFLKNRDTLYGNKSNPRVSRGKKLRRRIKNKGKRTNPGPGINDRSKSTRNTPVAQLCSVMICRGHGQGLDNGVRERKRRARKAGDGIQLSERTTLPKTRPRKSSTIDRDGWSLRRFFFNSNRRNDENLTIPAILSNRKPKVLHNFDKGKKKLKPKLQAKVPKVRKRKKKRNIVVGKISGNQIASKSYKKKKRKRTVKRIRHRKIRPDHKKFSSLSDRVRDHGIIGLGKESRNTAYLDFSEANSSVVEESIVEKFSTVSTAVNRDHPENGIAEIPSDISSFAENSPGLNRRITTKLKSNS